MKKYQKGNAVLVLIIIVVLVGLAFWYLMRSGYKFPGQTAQTPAVQNTANLDSLNKQLDNTNLNQMDAGINQVGSDSSSF